MKKSKLFFLAQISVLRDEELTYEEKLEIINVLIKEESLAKYTDKE